MIKGRLGDADFVVSGSAMRVTLMATPISGGALLSAGAAWHLEVHHDPTLYLAFSANLDRVGALRRSGARFFNSRVKRIGREKVLAEISFLRPVHSGKDRAKLAHKILHVCNKHKWDRSGGAIAGSSRIGGRPGCRFRGQRGEADRSRPLRSFKRQLLAICLLASF